MTAIATLLAEAKSTGSARLGSHEAQLDPAERTQLDAFVTYLTTVETKSANSARSYRSYVAQALAGVKAGKPVSGMSSDVKSGVNAFGRMFEFLGKCFG